MKIKLIAFGKLKSPGMRESADYYLRLIQPWAQIQELELKPQPVPNKSAATIEAIRIKEATNIEELIFSKNGSMGSKSSGLKEVYLLDETGKSFSTENWVKNFQKSEQRSVSEIVFCIGSSLGFHQSLKDKSKGLWSLGPQTLSHELVRVVLLEQVFRTLSILKGHPYHNG